MGIRKHILFVAVAAVAAGPVFLLLRRGGAPADEIATASPGPAPALAGAAAPPAPALTASDGADGPGALRLEGQAIDADKHPVGRAVITLVGHGAITAEADGSFAFDHLAEGDYRLVAESGALYAEDTVALSAISDPAVLTLKPGAALVLHVVADGQPVAGAQVEVMGRKVQTDAAGVVRCRGIELGSTMITVTAAQYAPLSTELATGDDPRATIERTVALQHGAPVDGVVVDQDGKPVPDATLWYHLASGPWHRWTDGDAQGRWHLDRVPAGKLVISAGSATHISTPDIAVAVDGEHARTGVVVRVELGAAVSGIVVDAAGKPVADAYVSLGHSTHSDDTGGFAVTGLEPGEIEVSATTPTQSSAIQKLQVPRAGRLQIRLVVVESRIAGRVTNPRGEPVPGVSVRASKVEGAASGWATTDELGAFDLGGLPGGDYEVVVSRADDREAQPRRMIVHAPDRRVALVLPEPAGVIGRVVLDGKPVDYFGVAFTVDPDHGFPAPSAVRATDGRFSDGHLQPGTWAVAIAGPAFVRKVITGVRIAEDTTTDLGDIVVQRGRSVSGTVRDERGRPVAGALVTIGTGTGANDDATLRLLTDGTRTAHSDAGGGYRVDGIDPETVALQIGATAEQGIAAATPLPPTATTLDLVIERTGSITGVIAHERGHMAVTARTAAGDYHFAWTDPDHEFAIDRLPPGDYTVEIDSSVITAPVHVTVTGDAAVRVDFALPAAPAADDR